MNKRAFMWVALSGIVLLVSVVLRLGLFSPEPSLTIHLRCENDVSGKLSIAMILPNGESGKKETFELQTVCKANQLELSDYKREKKLQFVYESINGETSKLVSEYGRDIHSDQNGFYLILKITNATPFIANDQL